MLEIGVRSQAHFGNSLKQQFIAQYVVNSQSLYILYSEVINYDLVYFRHSFWS